MSHFASCAVYLALVFVAAYTLCWLSAHCAMEDQVKDEWKSLTKEEQANDGIRNYFASTASDFASSRRQSIANRTALRFASGATLTWFIAYAVLANP